MFGDWLLAIGFPTTETFAARKAALLQASLGAEGARIYYSLSAAPGETDAVVIDRMKKHFGQPSGVIFNRAQFSRYTQRPGDSVVLYLSTLRELARKCSFPDNQFD